MSKIVSYGEEARHDLLQGVDFLANAVKVTEGPRGRNVILGQRALGQSPKVTRDGVTVANYVDPKHPTVQLGADLIREAAQKTDNAVGDGTTASIVLAQAMVHLGFEKIKSGANPMAMERGMAKAADAVIEQVKKSAVKVDPLTSEGEQKIDQVATVSAHGDTVIGGLVSGAIIKAGPDGVVTAEPSVTSDTYVQRVAGIELDKSNLISQVFITNPDEMKGELADAKILLWEGVIATAKSVVPLLKQIHELGTPLLIVSGGYEAEALACIINNKSKLALPLIAVRFDSYGQSRKDIMADIAALTGGLAFTEDLGRKFESIKLEELGAARKVIVDMRKTQIIEGRGDQAKLKGRVDHIRTQLDTAVEPEKSKLKRRLAALLGGITIIKVGGVTVTEMEEKRDRVVDALGAARAAVASGIVAGGGTALFRAREVLLGLELPDTEKKGADVVFEACESIVRQIAENAGYSKHDIIAQLKATDTLGFNAFSGKFENLIETGIIDPVHVVCEALKNSTTVARSIITMGATVAEENTEKING